MAGDAALLMTNLDAKRFSTSHRISHYMPWQVSRLLLFERFLHFFEVLQKADIVRHLMGALGDPAENRQHFCIDFPRISLSGNRDGFLESHLFDDSAVEFFYLFMISVEEIQEAGLCSRSSI